MKPRHLILIALVGLTSICIVSSRAKGQPAQNAAPTTQTDDERYERDVKRYEASMKVQEEADKRAAALMTREEELTGRYEKVLATWERQQQEYQRYLDTLPKK